MKYAAVIAAASFTMWIRNLHEATGRLLIESIEEFVGVTISDDDCKINCTGVWFNRHLQAMPSHNGSRRRKHIKNQTAGSSVADLESVSPPSVSPSLQPTIVVSGAPSSNFSAIIISQRNISQTHNPSYSNILNITDMPTATPSIDVSTAETTKSPPTLTNMNESTSDLGATNITWSGCVDPAVGYSAVEKTKITTICIIASDRGDWAKGVKYSRWLFQPIADEYSHFKIENSFKDLVLDKNVPVEIHVGSQQALTFIRRYFDYESKKVYPYLTAILDVKEGEVIGIAWDNACVFCGKNRCEEITYDFSGNPSVGEKDQTKGCYILKDECEELVREGSNKCDLNIYFVWTGTDKDGRSLHSSGSRWSAFPPSSIPEFDLSKISDFTDFF